jgi:hypothetical protein
VWLLTSASGGLWSAPHCRTRRPSFISPVTQHRVPRVLLVTRDPEATIRIMRVAPARENGAPPLEPRRHRPNILSPRQERNPIRLKRAEGAFDLVQRLVGMWRGQHGKHAEATLVMVCELPVHSLEVCATAAATLAPRKATAGSVCETIAVATPPWFMSSSDFCGVQLLTGGVSRRTTSTRAMAIPGDARQGGCAAILGRPPSMTISATRRDCDEPEVEAQGR